MNESRKSRVTFGQKSFRPSLCLCVRVPCLHICLCLFKWSSMNRRNQKRWITGQFNGHICKCIWLMSGSGCAFYICKAHLKLEGGPKCLATACHSLSPLFTVAEFVCEQLKMFPSITEDTKWLKYTWTVVTRKFTLHMESERVKWRWTLLDWWLCTVHLLFGGERS